MTNARANVIRWTPLTALAARFTSNVDALAGRYPDLADRLRSLLPSATYFVAAQGDDILLGTAAADRPGEVRPLPCSLPAARAGATVVQLCPTGAYTEPVLIVGEDQGWLWDRLYRLPVRSHPGYRVPLHLAIADLERLRALLHVQDWRDLLADPRVRLYAGPDAADQLRRSLADDWTIQRPTRWVTADTTFWPVGFDPEALLVAAGDARRGALAALTRPASPAEAAAVLDRLANGRPLRVLGCTSRYTTFLQHSMRDWLAAFDALGHETRLVIERADHQASDPLIDAAACAEFQPDLIVLIDHFRAEHPGFPAHVPVVMWVQDRLPNIFRAEAGAAQGPLDYALGYGRLELTRSHGFPRSRFLPAMIGVNEDRFSVDPLPAAALDPFRCDASFVSHATAPADRVVAAECDRVDAAGRGLLSDLFEQLRAVYDAGGAISDGDVIHRMVVRTLADRRMSADVQPLVDLFVHRVNNALFRHQALGWVAESGVDLRLYGRGWEQHPAFARYARGVADNAADLRAIYQASAINLQVTPFGAVHQRLLDGLSAGGFFLLRSTAADEHEAIRRQMWDWSRRHAARDGHDMLARRDGELSELIGRYAAAGAVPLEADPAFVFNALEECAATGFTRTPNTLWDDAGRVTFDTREQLQALVRHYLAAPAERVAVARSMRQRVLDTHTYSAVARRLLGMIADDLRGRPAAVAA